MVDNAAMHPKSTLMEDVPEKPWGLRLVLEVGILYRICTKA